MSNDRQAPKQVEQRRKVARMDWDKANEQWHWADKNLPNGSAYKAMLADHLKHLELEERRGQLLPSYR